MAPIFIGIEGTGMRKSVAVVADETGKIIGAATEKFGISLHALSRDILQSRLRRLIQAAASSAGRDLNSLSDATICIGLTGVTFPYDAEVDLPREFQELHVNVKKLICTGDAEIVCASHIQQSIGAAILCHMGSIAYVSKGPEFKDRFRVGGWGPALGDEGSGYWMGRLALRAIGVEFEQKKEPTAFWQSISDWLSKPDPEVPAWNHAQVAWTRILNDYSANEYTDWRPAVFTFAHEISRESIADWREVASGLVHVIINSAIEGGDKTAINIMEEAIECLTNQFVEASDISNTLTDSIPLVLYGGVLTHNPRFREKLIESVQTKHTGKLTLVYPGIKGAMRPACGALLFALANSDTTNLRLPKASIIERVKTDAAVTKITGELIND